MSDETEHHRQRWHTVIPSALGDLTLVRDAEQLRGLYFPHHWHVRDRASFGRRSDDGFVQAITQLQEYLAGSRRQFDLAFTAEGNRLQRRVWDLISETSFGHTVTYGELAARLSGEVTAQQVGAAIGRNPLCIFIPCHRVIGSGGRLTGYAGGLRRKRQLLELEAAHAPHLDGAPFQPALVEGSW